MVRVNTMSALLAGLGLLLLLLAVGGWPISQPPRAEAFRRPSAQPVSTQRCMRVCVYRLGL